MHNLLNTQKHEKHDVHYIHFLSLSLSELGFLSFLLFYFVFLLFAHLHVRLLLFIQVVQNLRNLLKKRRIEKLKINQLFCLVGDT